MGYATYGSTSDTRPELASLEALVAVQRREIEELAVALGRAARWMTYPFDPTRTPELWERYRAMQEEIAGLLARYPEAQARATWQVVRG